MRTLLAVTTACLLALTSSANARNYNFPPLNYGLPWNNINPNQNILQSSAPQGSSASQEVCGVLNGAFKTFTCLNEFMEYVRQGYTFTFYCNGPCPPAQKNCAATYDPICASNLLERKTFSSLCAMREENRKTGSHWIKISTGICPVKTTTTTSTTPKPCEVTTTEATTETTLEPTTEETTSETTTEYPTTETTEITSTPEPSNETTVFEVDAANDIETTPAPTDCESEDTNMPSQDIFGSFLNSLSGISFANLPSASKISFRNNVNNKYNVYAEGNVYNAPCQTPCNGSCKTSKC